MPTGRGAKREPDYPVRQWLTAYNHGDVNRHEQLDEWRYGPDGWIVNAPKAGPYLTHVKALSAQWPHLQLLADFMDVGTTPIRWNPKAPGGYPEDVHDRAKQRYDRMQKTQICVLEYPHEGTSIKTKELDEPAKLDEYLSLLQEAPSTKLRLFVVEDLSRSTIESLGSHFDIDPSFFREHTVDYAWYNISDWWRDPPNLDIVSRGQNWFQLRYVRARYFGSEESFKQGDDESKSFNVFRRLDSDYNSNGFWDKHNKNEARVGLTRSRATFWVQPPKDKGGTTVGILLLDPTIEEGNPLWVKYRNWERPPRMGSTLPKGAPPSDNFFADFIYWASRPEAFDFLGSGNFSSPICVPTQALLHLVCNEWLTMVDYIKTRLNQVDWGIAFPDHFLTKEEQIDEALTKLHHWRRVVPLYRDMLAETFLRVFREAQHPAKMHPPANSPGHHRPPSALDMLMDTSCINAYKQDFSLVLRDMQEYQERIDRLTAVVTAVITIQDSRRGYKDNKNLQWLTWLATFFIPLSFVATLLSMTTSPLYQLRDATILWAEVSVPSGLLILSVVGVMSIAKCRRAIRGFFNSFKFPRLGKWWPFDLHKRH